MLQSPEISELAKALAAAQGEINPAVKNAQNPHLRNRYADIAAVWEAARPVLSKNGLAVTQTMVPRDDGRACVRTMLLHTSGQWIAGECALPCPKQDPQGYGSAITYARRYSLSAMLGVVSEDDDDGERAKDDTQARAKKREESKAFREKVREHDAQAQQEGMDQIDEGMALFDVKTANSVADLNQVYAQHKDAANSNGWHKNLVEACAKRKAELIANNAKETGSLTDGQRKAIMAHYGAMPRDKRLADMSAFLGREVSTFSALTKEEAGSFIDAITSDKKPQEAA